MPAAVAPSRLGTSTTGYPTDLILPAQDAAMANMQMSGMATMSMPDPLARVTASSRTYDYPLQQRAATLWYHDHRMDFTGPDVWRGLAGFFLIGDNDEDQLPLPRGDHDIPMMMADRAFAADGSLAYPSLDPTLLHRPGVQVAYSAGVLGDVILVNGVPWPYAEVDRARYRIRLLNASNARRYRLVLDPPPPGGGGLVQIGTDGDCSPGPCTTTQSRSPPAQRFDVIVDFSSYRPGATINLVNEFGTGTTREVLQFRVGSTPARDDTHIPSVLSTTAPPPAATVAAAAVRTRTFKFQEGYHNGMRTWLINGQPFDPQHAIATPRLGTTEMWRLITDFHHPVHLHLTHFQILSRGTAGPGVYDAGWKDTIDLRPAEEASIAVRFDDYAGRYVLHCHNLEHEDMAMMANFTTTD